MDLGNRVDPHFHYRFTEACSRGLPELMREIISKGYDPFGDGSNPLAYAASQGRDNVVGILIDEAKKRFQQDPARLIQVLDDSRQWKSPGLFLELTDMTPFHNNDAIGRCNVQIVAAMREVLPRLPEHQRKVYEDRINGPSYYGRWDNEAGGGAGRW